MSTKFYLPTAGTCDINIPYSGIWTVTTAAARFYTTFTGSGTAFATVQSNNSSTTNNILLRQFVTPPLAAQTFGGRVSGQIRGIESNAAMNCMPAACLRVVSNDGTVERGILTNFRTGVLEFATSLTNRFIPSGVALFAVTCQKGDRLIMEFGGRQDAASANRNFSLRFGDPLATADLPKDNSSTSDLLPWIEFTQNIDFYTEKYMFGLARIQKDPTYPIQGLARLESNTTHSIQGVASIAVGAQNYYVRKTGKDTNDGLTPATAWQSIGKALGADGISEGDTVYIGAGVYRETITVGMTSATEETKIIGDVDGIYTGDEGEVVISAYTTNDYTNPAADTTLDINTRDYLTFENITFIGGNASPSCVSGTSPDHITFRRCYFINARTANQITLTNNADHALDWTEEECIHVAGPASPIFGITANRSAVADYSLNMLFKNCMFYGGSTTIISLTSAVAGQPFLPGGITGYNCLFFGGTRAIWASDTGISREIPLALYNSVCIGQTTAGLVAASGGQIIEDYNWLLAGVPRTNVATGLNSVAASGANGVAVYAPLLQYNQELYQNKELRPFFQHMLTSPGLGFGSNPTGYTTVTKDIMGYVRPVGAGFSPVTATGKAVGPFERHNTALRTSGTYNLPPNALVLTGPSVHDFQIPVNTTNTKISIYGMYDSSYNGTNPQLAIVDAYQCGISDTTGTMVAAANTWEKLTVPITPTAAGIATVRIYNTSTGVTGNAYFDNFNLY